MVKFIKVTDSLSSEYINVETICSIFVPRNPRKDGINTQLFFTTGRSIECKETIEELLNLIKVA